MKKIFTLIAMAVFAVNTFAADDVYYPETEYQNCDYGWWLNFTETYSLQAGKSAEFIFYNYNGGATSNWYNWDLVACTTGWSVRNGDGYSEYFVLRSDNYGWGDYYNGDGFSNTYDWTDFPGLMDGALVDMTVSLGTDGTFTMTSTTTDTDGNTYDYSYKCTITTAPEEIWVFFTAENSYMSTEQVEDTDDGDDDETVEVEDTPVDTSTAEVYYPVSEYQNCDNAYWVNFTDDYTLNAGTAIRFIFYNYNGGATSNWYNWMLVASTTGWTERNGDGYSEYFVVRADNYGWGDYYNGDGFSNTYDWTDFPGLMDGALVDMTISLTTAGTFTLTSTTTDTDGNTYDYSYTCSITTAPEAISVAFGTEYSYIGSAESDDTEEDSGVTDGITTVETVTSATAGTAYNLAGQSVGKSYKGIVIENGKKVLRK